MKSVWHILLIGVFSIFLACKSDKPIVTETINEVQDSVQVPEIELSFVMGKFDPEDHEDFVEIDPTYSDKEGRLMQKDAYEAFKQMYEAALKDSIQLRIVSATRNFDYQKGIWERKWTGVTKIENGVNAAETYQDPAVRAKKILQYSSMPSTSRHHWGTDIDLNNFENEWFESGEGLAVFTWLEENASKFGFCRPYTQKGVARPNGYEEEKWHWSYIPLAKAYTKKASEALQNESISGFQGANTAVEIDVVKNYVLGINQECL